MYPFEIIERLAKEIERLMHTPRTAFDQGDFETLITLRDKLTAIVDHVEGDPS